MDDLLNEATDHGAGVLAFLASAATQATAQAARAQAARARELGGERWAA